MTEFHLLPIASYSTGFIRLSCTLHIFAWQNGKLLEGRLDRKSSFALFAAILQVSTCHVTCMLGGPSTKQLR